MIEQFAIALFGVTAVFLSQTTSYVKYACIFGLVGQPFWFYAAYKAEQWGVFVLCILYTIAWAKGIKSYWLNPDNT